MSYQVIMEASCEYQAVALANKLVDQTYTTKTPTASYTVPEFVNDMAGYCPLTYEMSH